jgi:hypothetical protein
MLAGSRGRGGFFIEGRGRTLLNGLCRTQGYYQAWDPKRRNGRANHDAVRFLTVRTGRHRVF